MIKTSGTKMNKPTEDEIKRVMMALRDREDELRGVGFPCAHIYEAIRIIEYELLHPKEVAEQLLKHPHRHGDQLG